MQIVTRSVQICGSKSIATQIPFELRARRRCWRQSARLGSRIAGNARRLEDLGGSLHIEPDLRPGFSVTRSLAEAAGSV